MAGVGQTAISLIERGRLDRTTLRVIRRVFNAVDAEFVGSVTWRGGDLDRLLDEGHAALVGAVIELLRQRGWEVRPEVTFSIYGERGSIDVLAWHGPTRTLLVIEVKTEITSVEETLRRHDVKVRLASRIAREQFALAPAVVARLLVVRPESSTVRRRLARQRNVFAQAYPLSGRAVHSWIARPSGPMGALLFIPSSPSTLRSVVSRKRIRHRRASSSSAARTAIQDLVTRGEPSTRSRPSTSARGTG